MPNETHSPRRILRHKETSRRTGLSRPSLYRLMAVGEFPQAVQLSQKAVGWFEDEVDDWIESRQRAPVTKQQIARAEKSQAA